MRNKLVASAALVLLSFAWFSIGHAGSNDVSGIRDFDNLVRAGKATRPKAGVSWRERVMKDRAVMKRASERRNALKRSALDGKHESMRGQTVDSYNARILKRNAGILRAQRRRNAATPTQ